MRVREVLMAHKCECAVSSLEAGAYHSLTITVERGI